ncbi:MAG: DUF4153 domain-containing protein [Gammaproteobacteria bacterium]|nr:DUF4153 domain-containing protein [Gammaproteobacteria bacterium]
MNIIKETQAWLSRENHGFIIIVSLLQALGLLWVKYADDSEGLKNLPEYVITFLYAWLSIVPTVVMLSLLRLEKNKAAIAALVYGLIFAGMMFIDASRYIDGVNDFYGNSFIFSCLSVLSIAAFVLIGLLWANPTFSRRMPQWPDLCEQSVGVASLLASVLFLELISWGVLWLWASLFEIVKISFFKDLFFDYNFAIVFCCVFGAVLLIVLRQVKLHEELIDKVFAFSGRVLSPVLALLSLTFVVVLPFTGLEPLWETKTAAATMLWLIVLSITFFNLAERNQLAATGWRKLVRNLSWLGLLALPIYCGLAAYAVYLRINQYGWTLDRLWGVWVCIAASLFALSYAILAARYGVHWNRFLKPANYMLSLVLLVLLIAPYTPAVNFYAISAHSQAQRILKNPVEPTIEELRYLRFNLGRAGVKQLEKLKIFYEKKGSASLVIDIDRLLKQKKREVEDAAKDSEIEDYITLIPVNQAIPEDFRQYLETKEIDLMNRCLEAGNKCYLFNINMDNYPDSEWVLLKDYYYNTNGYVFSFNTKNSEWSQIASLTKSSGCAKNLRDSLMKGEYQAVPAMFKTLKIGNLEYQASFATKDCND